MPMETPLNNGITADTPNSVMLGAGTIHKGLVYDGSTGWNFRESLIGATGDGNTLAITPEITDLAPDGAWVKVQGLLVKTGETATLEISPIEINKDLIKMAAIAGEGTSDVTGYDMLESKEFLQIGDYIEDFGWVGLTIGGDPMIVIFPFAYCSGGLSLEGKSKDKSAPKMTIECVQAPGASTRKLPYKIYTQAPAQG